MKICKKEVASKKLEFNDIEIGDVLVFPGVDSWREGMFMRIWASGSYGKTIEQMDSLLLVRLDGTGKINAPQGQTYTLTRQMMGAGVACGSEGKQRFIPVRRDACITLGEEI